MFKKFFHSGYPVCFLYVFGIGFWISASFSNTYKLFFCLAIICIIAGFLLSLPWLWKHRLFERPRSTSPYSRRYSDKHPNPHSDLVSHEYAKTHGERRRHRRRKPEKRNNLRWTAEVISTLLFIAACVGLRNSYVARSFKESPVIDVLLSDRKMIQPIPGEQPTMEQVLARRAPFLERTVAFRKIVFTLADTPTEDVPINQKDKSKKIDVILRNLNGVDVSNAHVTVESDVPITPVTEGLVSLTDKQLYGDMPHVTPPDHSSDERVITVEIPIPQNQDTAGIYVTIQADNLKSYAAVARVYFVRDSEPSPAAAAADASPQ